MLASRAAAHAARCTLTGKVTAALDDGTGQISPALRPLGASTTRTVPALSTPAGLRQNRQFCAPPPAAISPSTASAYSAGRMHA